MNALDQIAPLSNARRDEIVAAYYRSQREPMQIGLNGLVAWNAVPDLAADNERLHRENARLAEELRQAKARLLAVSLVRAWMNEDNKAFVFADDLRRALGEVADHA